MIKPEHILKFSQANLRMHTQREGIRGTFLTRTKIHVAILSALPPHYN